MPYGRSRPIASRSTRSCNMHSSRAFLPSPADFGPESCFPASVQKSFKV